MITARKSLLYIQGFSLIAIFISIPQQKQHHMLYDCHAISEYIYTDYSQGRILYNIYNIIILFHSIVHAKVLTFPASVLVKFWMS